MNNLTQKKILQKNPLDYVDISDVEKAKSYMKKYDLSSTSNNIKSSSEYQTLIDRLKYQFRIYGLTLKDEFHDFDVAKSNYITNNQFRRILKTHKIDLTDDEFKLIQAVFDDRVETNE